MSNPLLNPHQFSTGAPTIMGPLPPNPTMTNQQQPQPQLQQPPQLQQQRPPQNQQHQQFGSQGINYMSNKMPQGGNPTATATGGVFTNGPMPPSISQPQQYLNQVPQSGNVNNLNRMMPPPLQSSLTSSPVTTQQHNHQQQAQVWPSGGPPPPNINQLIPNMQQISLNGPTPPSSANNTSTPTNINNNNLPPVSTNQIPQYTTMSTPPRPMQNSPIPSNTANQMKQSIRPMYPSQQGPTQSIAQPTQQQPMTNQYQQYYNGGQQQPQPQQQQQQPQYGSQPLQYQSQQPTGFNRIYGNPDVVDLMQNRHILPQEGYSPPPVSLNNTFSDSVNCDPNIFRCTLNKIPETNNLLQKSRLPLGILIHPFRDLSNLPVVSCSQIVRCRACRTYINPFVYFVDSKKWKCNLCYRVNELPDEFQYDPVTKSYGDVTRRPEVRSSTIEFIAPSEYMLRPPQPAMYLFLLDVSMVAIQSGYLSLVCDSLAEHLDKLPGDARTQIGFIAYNSYVHFYSIAEGYNRPHEITIVELDDIFMPRPDNLLINLKENRELLNDLLDMLPKRFENSHDAGSALGAALQVAYKMMSATGGRVTVFQTCLPNKGPGALQSREDPNNRSSKEIQHLGPATDFYKRLALEYSGQQIAVDLFLLNCQYSDLATISGISKFSGGSIYHIPLFNIVKKQESMMFKRTFERYLTRKIGFEAVMRVRCTRGLVIHTFHGNFFVRSTDLLSLPNVNPDAGFGMQISYDESLQDVRTVCFQAALLYTSSKGERRIRVHTLCLPVTNSLTDIMYSADAHCIVGLLSKMAVDRSIQSTLTDARDAFINATIDVLSAFRIAQNLPQGSSGQLQVPKNLSLLPLYISALLKNIAFRTGTSTRLDDRVFAMCELKTLPLDQLIKFIYPDFYHIDSLFMPAAEQNGGDQLAKHLPPKRQLSAEFLDSRSMYLLDIGVKVLLYVGSNVNPQMLKSIIGVQAINEIPDMCFDLQTLNTHENEQLHSFIDQLNEDKPYPAIVQIIRDTSACRNVFTERLIDDRTDSSLSYYEFLQHMRTQVK